MGDVDPHLIHLDRFSRFCRLTAVTERPTDRQTDHATRPVTIGLIYVRSTAMRPINSNSNNHQRRRRRRCRHCVLVMHLVPSGIPHHVSGRL